MEHHEGYLQFGFDREDLMGVLDLADCELWIADNQDELGMSK